MNTTDGMSSAALHYRYAKRELCVNTNPVPRRLHIPKVPTLCLWAILYPPK